MTTTVPLSVTIQVALNASGNGTASAGPQSAREVWNPQTVHVSVSTDVSESQCTIYVGDAPTQANFRDTTVSGSLGDSTDRVGSDTVKCGAKIWAVWAGGDPKASATMQITGTKDV